MVNTVCSWYKKERKERFCIVLQQPLITVRGGGRNQAGVFRAGISLVEVLAGKDPWIQKLGC